MLPRALDLRRWSLSSASLRDPAKHRASSRRTRDRTWSIVGGGFGGLTAAQALESAPVRVTLLDRTNHHTFQPLLYQVAMAGLSPAEIAQPIRAIVRRKRNARC